MADGEEEGARDHAMYELFQSVLRLEYPRHNALLVKGASPRGRRILERTNCCGAFS
jgi:hypothetical protein